MASAAAAPASPRSSTSSDSFSSGRHSPVHGYDSSAALILVSDQDDHAEDEHDPAQFDFSSDDEHEDEEQLLDPPLSSTVPPLSTITIFLYLLSPLIKLGALLSVDEAGQLPLRPALLALFFFAGLSAFTRQIWYMLARYVRRADMEDILLETFARGRGRERKRKTIRSTVRLLTGVLRVLLVAVYLRASADAILPLMPPKLLIFSSRLVVTSLLVLAVSPLCFGPSLDVPIVLYPTWLSVASYIGWVACTAYAHANGVLQVNPRDTALGPLWQGLSIVAFTFTTSSTLPLYAALKGTHHHGIPKPKRSRSWKLISMLSVVFAALLVLPPTIFRSTTPSEASMQDSSTPPLGLQASMAALSVLTLILGIPSTLVTTPPVPVPLAIRRNTNFPVSRVFLFFIALGISVAPLVIARVVSDVLLLLAFLSTYAVPALIHIVIHNFRRPLSIIIPPASPSTPGRPNVHRSDSHSDELLQRKERTLQRRRLARRIAWDISVWVLLLPVGGGGLVWAAGRVLRRW